MQAFGDYVQTGLIYADKISDYIPFWSKYSNAACLVAKGILFSMQIHTPSTYAQITSLPIVKHLNDKSVLECVALAIPYLNIVIAVVRDFSAYLLNMTPSHPTPVYVPPSKPAPASGFSQVIDDLEKEVQRSTEETLEKARNLEEQRKENYEKSKREAEEQHAAHLKKLQDRFDSQPTDTDDGIKKRELLKGLMDSVKSTHVSHLKSLKTLYQM